MRIHVFTSKTSYSQFMADQYNNTNNKRGNVCTI